MDQRLDQHMVRHRFHHAQASGDASDGDTLVYHPGVDTLSHKLEHLQDGMYINVSNIQHNSTGTRRMRKSGTMRTIVIPGLNIGATSLDQYGLALQFLVKDGYLTRRRAIYYYVQFMESLDNLTPEQEDNALAQFERSIGYSIMVKSTRKR